MNLKLLTLIILSLFGLVSVRAMSYGKTDVPPNSTEIVLRGDLDNNQGPNSIEAYFNTNTVVVIFHQDFGYLDVILVGEECGVVYNQCINTAVQTIVYIPITGVPDGRYTLILNNSFGNSEGEFEKE